MGKKMKLLPFFSNKPTTNPTTAASSMDPAAVIANPITAAASPLPWQWASCANINTLSFRDKEDIDVGLFRMVNYNSVDVETERPCSSSNSPSSSSLVNNNTTNCSSSCPDEDGRREESISRRSFSTATTTTNLAEAGGPPSPSFSAVEILDDDQDLASVEMVIKGLKSERLFFEPVGKTNSIFDEKSNIIDSQRKSLSSSINPIDVNTSRTTHTTNTITAATVVDDTTIFPEKTTPVVPFKESVILSLESKDPCGDFRQSMEEMVEAHGVKDWESMEELLAWYLKVNGKSNHGYIVSAFVDLLVDLTSVSSTTTPPPPRMSSKNDDDDDKNNNNSSTSTSSASANCLGSSSSFSLCRYSSPSPTSSSPLSFPCSPLRSGSERAAAAVAGSGGGRLSCSCLDPSECDGEGN